MSVLTLALRLLSVAEIEFGFETMNSTLPFTVSAAPETPTVEVLGLTILPIPTFGGLANYNERR
jgi:hypothetical protein